MNFEHTKTFNAIVSKEQKLPVWVVVDSLSYYFYFNQDSICTINVGNDSLIIETFEFSYNDSIVCGNNKYSNHDLKRNIWILVSLLEGHLNESDALEKLIIEFKTLLETSESENGDEYVSKTNQYPKLNNVFVFSKSGYSPKFIIGNIYYSVVVYTGKSYNIKSNSATLEGAVRCASSQYNSHGNYGIICDEDPNNLSIESAKYKIPGHQEKLSLSFNVNASGLKYNTQYYYRTYFKIAGKSDLVYRYGKDIQANATYGKIKEFKTLCPSAITQDVINVSHNSVRLCCSFENVTSEMECGVLLFNEEEELKSTVTPTEGKHEFSFSGLKPATSYNYCAYIKIDGTMVTAGETKSFTTELPDISGTWSCTEEYYPYSWSSTPSYKTYTLTLNKDGSATCSDYENIVSGSWSFISDGTVTIDIMTIATTTTNSGVNWSGTVEDMVNPTKIVGSTYSWNYNQIGSFQGDSHKIVMTK